jgi:hypothetical protein
MSELSAHYNLNIVEGASCKLLPPAIQHFEASLDGDFQLDLVDEELQQHALEYIGDLLGVEPLERTASRMCAMVTKALHIDETSYNGAPSGLPSVPTTDFKRFPGCHETLTVRDHELVFCSEEVARLGPMSNINSLVHLSTSLAKIAIQEALSEATGRPHFTTKDEAPHSQRVFPSTLALPEYFKLFWSVATFNYRIRELDLQFTTHGTGAAAIVATLICWGPREPQAPAKPLVARVKDTSLMHVCSCKTSWSTLSGYVDAYRLIARTVFVTSCGLHVHRL